MEVQEKYEEEINKRYLATVSILKLLAGARIEEKRMPQDGAIAFSHNKIEFDLNSILRDVLYTAPKSPILELLKRMRLSRIHIALVVDGIGGVDGLVTIEDLIEEIVGEIEDEHDAEDIDEEIIKKEDNLLIVDAAYRIDELEKDFNINLTVADEEEIETVGGLVFSKINRIPKSNEEFNIDDIINIKILRANERKILTVHITKIVN